jgi:hypothetical protein
MLAMQIIERAKQKCRVVKVSAAADEKAMLHAPTIARHRFAGWPPR